MAETRQRTRRSSNPWTMLDGAARRLASPRVEGGHHLPAAGAVVMASNHLSHLDTAILRSAFDRDISFVGGSAEGRLDADALEDLGIITIDETRPDAGRQALAAAVDVLERGEAFGIFPEGPVTPDGTLHKGRTAVARMALATRSPIVPVAIIGSADIDQLAPTPGDVSSCTIKVGEPIDVRRHDDSDDLARVYRQLTDEVMFEIMSLSGQRYTHEYATS